MDCNTIKEYICPQLVAFAKANNVAGIYHAEYLKLNDIKSLNNWIENTQQKIKAALNINQAESSVVDRTQRRVPTVITYSNSTEQADMSERFYNVQGEQVASSIYKQIKGGSANDKTKKRLSKITSDNVMTVIREYDKLTNGKESLVRAIDNEWGLDYKTVKQYVGHNLIAYGKAHNVNLNSLIEEYNKAEDIDALEDVINRIYNKINSTVKPDTQSKTFKPYLQYLGNKEDNKKFEKATGASLNYMILTDTAISAKDRIAAIRESFTRYNRYAQAVNVNIDDILADANKDLQDLVNNKDFKRYSSLYTTTIERLQARIYRNSGTSTLANGKIDNEFKQGGVGDCWFLASIKALSMKPKGLQILNDSLKVDDKGNVTVHLKGVNKTYTISREEIENARELSTGDADVRALEIAVNRYLREDYKEKNGERASFDGNHANMAYRILTGKGEHFFPIGSRGDTLVNPEYYGDGMDEDLLDSFNKKDRIVCVSSGSGTNMNISCAGNNQNVTLYSGHAYTVSRTDSKYVYLINPWDTSVEIPIERKDFLGFFDNVDQFDL